MIIHFILRRTKLGYQDITWLNSSPLGVGRVLVMQENTVAEYLQVVLG